MYYEGYENSGETITHRGHTYAVYRKETAERWPDYSHLPGMGAWHANNSTYKRPAHHDTERQDDPRYSGPVYHAATRTYGPRTEVSR